MTKTKLADPEPAPERDAKADEILASLAGYPKGLLVGDVARAVVIKEADALARLSLLEAAGLVERRLYGGVVHYVRR